MKVEKIKIICKMATPVVLPGSLALDSILAYAKIQQEIEKKDEFLYDIELPLRKIKPKSGDFFWDCSEGIIGKIRKRDRFPIKKAVTTNGLRKNINIASGKHCSERFDDEEIDCEELIFYAAGDPEKIIKLMSGITSLGKYRKFGKGIIEKTIIERFDNDYAVAQKCELCCSSETLTRPIPIEMSWVKNFDKSYCIRLVYKRIRPPYNREQGSFGQQLCLAAGSIVPDTFIRQNYDLFC